MTLVFEDTTSTVGYLYQQTLKFTRHKKPLNHINHQNYIIIEIRLFCQTQIKNFKVGF